jgi:hypothetical protein
MQTRWPWLALIVPLALGASGAALAGPLDGPEQRAAMLAQRRERLKQKWEAEFRAADTDADRALTRDEMQAGKLPSALLEHFDDIDRDHDGHVTPEELWAVYGKRVDDQHARPAQ